MKILRSKNLNYRLRALLLLAALVACDQGEAQNSVLTPDEFQARLEKTSEGVLIDVRTPEEYTQQHIPKAVNIDWRSGEFEQQADTLQKDHPVMVYCYSGHRSAEAAEALRKMGFTQVYELKGGLKGWREAGKKTE